MPTANPSTGAMANQSHPEREAAGAAHALQTLDECTDSDERTHGGGESDSGGVMIREHSLPVEPLPMEEPETKTSNVLRPYSVMRSPISQSSTN